MCSFLLLSHQQNCERQAATIYGWFQKKKKNTKGINTKRNGRGNFKLCSQKTTKSQSNYIKSVNWLSIIENYVIETIKRKEYVIVRQDKIEFWKNAVSDVLFLPRLASTPTNLCFDVGTSLPTSSSKHKIRVFEGQVARIGSVIEINYIFYTIQMNFVYKQPTHCLFSVLLLWVLWIKVFVKSKSFYVF